MSTLKRQTAYVLLVYMLYILLAYLFLLGSMTGCAGPESDRAVADAEEASLARGSTTESASSEAGLTEAERLELERMAAQSVDYLVNTSEPARQLFKKSEGFAVFDSTKVGALVTGAGGSGVAVDPEANQCIYMHMGAGGVAVGGGIQKYKLVLLFEDDESFQQFVSGQWDGGATAQAVAGKAAAEAASNFVDGMAVYQLTDKGLIAQADLTVIRFWQDHDAPTTKPDALRCAS